MKKRSLLLLVLALLMVVGANASATDGKTVMLEDFETGTIEAGRWNADSATRITISWESFEGDYCGKIEMPYMTAYGYQKIRLLNLDASKWTKDTRIVFYVKGDGSSNFVRVSFWEDINHGYENWIATGDGFVEADVPEGEIATGFISLASTEWQRIEIDLTKLYPGNQVGKGNGEMDIRALSSLVFEIWPVKGTSLLDRRTFYIDSVMAVGVE